MPRSTTWSIHLCARRLQAGWVLHRLCHDTHLVLTWCQCRCSLQEMTVTSGPTRPSTKLKPPPTLVCLQLLEAQARVHLGRQVEAGFHIRANLAGEKQNKQNKNMGGSTTRWRLSLSTSCNRVQKRRATTLRSGPQSCYKYRYWLPHNI